MPPKPSHDGEEARGLLEERGLPLFKAEIPRLVAFQKAALQGRTVNKVGDPRAESAWRAYVGVGRRSPSGQP